MSVNRFWRNVFVGAVILVSAALAPSGVALGQTPMQRWADLLSRGQLREAEQLARQIIASERTPERRIRAMTCLSLTLRSQDRLDEAVQVLVEADAYCRQTVGADSHSMGDLVFDLGSVNYVRGNYAEAERLLRQAIALYGRHPLVDGETIDPLLTLIAVFLEQGRLADADQLCQQTVSTLRRSNFVGNNLKLGAALTFWARAATDQGRYDLAEPRFREALTIQVQAYGESPAAAEAASNLSTALMAQNRYDEARPFIEWAQKLCQRLHGPNSSQMAGILVNYGDLNLKTGHLEEALAQFEQSVAIKQALFGPDSARYAKSLISLAIVRGRMSQFAEAEDALRKALAITERVEGPESANLAIINSTLATMLLEQHKLDQARDVATKAITIYELAGAADRASEAYFKRARVEWRSGRRKEALADLSKAMELAEEQRTRAAGAELERAAQFGKFGDAFEQMVAWQLEMNDPAQALAAIERWRARSFIDELQLGNVDLLAGRSREERAELQARESELRGKITALERQLDRLENPNEATAEQKQQRDRILGDLVEARNALYGHWRQLRSTSSVYQRLITTSQHVPTFAELNSQLLGPKGMALAYLFGEQGSYLVTLDATGSHVCSLFLDEAQASELGVSKGALTRAVLSQILADGQGQGVVQQLAVAEQAPQAAKRLAALWQVLVPKEQRERIIGGQVDRLVILPDGPLSLLPFEALVVEEGENIKYLLDVGPPVLYGPSATVLENLANRQAPAAGRQARQAVLTFGNPNYSSDPANSAADLANRNRAGGTRMQLSPLPYSGIESQWVADIFGKQGLQALRFTGGKATEANLRANIAGRRVVHLACHGMSDDAYGNFFGALALAPGKANDPADDGMLRLAEIYDLPLDGCELAILSACMTNYGPQQQGEGVWALSRGFLVAGSKRVVASNWVVDDEAGASLISYFCSVLAKAGQDGSADYALALQQAKRWVRGQEKWQSPFYWATFELVGPP